MMIFHSKDLINHFDPSSLDVSIQRILFYYHDNC